MAESLLRESPGKAGILDVFANARIDSRALAMPLEWYLEPHGFKQRNAAYAEVGLGLVGEAAAGALKNAHLAAGDVAGIVMVSTTGLATPSLDARLANRIGLPADIVRLPVWGLGCAGGVAGLSRGVELARNREGPVLVVALELCTLSFDVQKAIGGLGGAPDKKAIVAASLFGDGCAAVVVDSESKGGLQYQAGASHLFPDTERVMGWDVEDHNLDVVLSPRIPDIVRAESSRLVQDFLAKHNQGQRPNHWLLHPGGAKVVDAYREAVGLDEKDLAITENVLRQHGNMSSPTVLFALQEAQRRGFKPGETGLLTALGPGFSSEMALVRS